MKHSKLFFLRTGLVILLSLLIFVFGLDPVEAVSTSVIGDNNKAVEFYKDWLKKVQEKQKQMQLQQQEAQNNSEKSGKALEAESAWSESDLELLLSAKDLFLKALVSDPQQPELHLNYGVTLELTKEEEKSLKEYLLAAELSPKKSALQFSAFVNAARVWAKMKSIDKALEYYQRALAIVPESKEVKTNIELLWQQQQGQGEGEGGEGQEGDSSKDPQEPKEQDQKDQGQEPQKKPQPKPFKSKELTKEDVRRILEEIKNQEQKIREKVNQKNIKEPPREKDW